MKRIIVNADDFGLNESCNKAISRCFREGLITDTTIIANGNAFAEAAWLGTTEFSGKVGIHFNLTEGKPLTATIKSLPSFCKDGIFHGNVRRMKRLSKHERNAVYEELSAQCQKVKEAGIDITHADSHHHIHTGIFIAPIVFRVCRENGIKAVRLHRNLGKISLPKRIVKFIYNTVLRKSFISTDYMGSAEDVNLLEPKAGTIEIMVHPVLDSSGNIIDKRVNGGPKLESVKYWTNSKKISYNQL